MFFKIAERKGKWKGMLSTFNMAERKGKAVQFRLDGTERKCFPKKMDRLTCMPIVKKQTGEFELLITQDKN